MTHSVPIDDVRAQRDELLREIMRLPQPPTELGDGPFERVQYALDEIERLTQDRGEAEESESAVIFTLQVELGLGTTADMQAIVAEIRKLQEAAARAARGREEEPR